MTPNKKATEDAGFQLDIDQSATRYAKHAQKHSTAHQQGHKSKQGRKRKNSPMVAWGIVCAIAAAIVIFLVLGLWLSQEDSGLVKILPISEQAVTQGDLLRVPIAVQREGRRQTALTYSLGEGPPNSTVDAKTGEFVWRTGDKHAPGTYWISVNVRAAGQPSLSDQQTFAVRLEGKLPRPALKKDDSGLAGFGLPDMGSFRDPLQLMNPFEIQGELAPRNKIDEFAFAKLRQLEIEPSPLGSDAVFLRRVFLDTIGTLPTADEARSFLEDQSPGKRAALIDHLLERPEFADYWGLKWGDLLRVKAEFPINLWPAGAMAYDRWIRTSLRDNMPYDQFVRELLTGCGSNFRTPQVNFFRALQTIDSRSIAQAAALAFMGVRAESWPEERWAGMAVFFSQVGYKPTREWKEEIVIFDPRKATPSPEGGPPVGVFPDGTKVAIPAGQDPRELFADWLIDAKNPWFARHIVNRVWYWLLGRGIVHQPDDIRAGNPAQNPELLNWLADELVQADWDLKHIYRVILNSATYQLSFIPKSPNPEAASNFACYPLRRLDAEVLIDAICQITGTTESYSSMIPEPFTFIPERHRSITLPDGSITSSVLELFGRPPRDTGLESERNNSLTAAQSLHLLNSSHILNKIRKGPKIDELLTSTSSEELVDTLYLTILSRPPTDNERNEFGWSNSRWDAENLIWALINSEEFLFRH